VKGQMFRQLNKNTEQEFCRINYSAENTIL
jgi:hypothetical protein